MDHYINFKNIYHFSKKNNFTYTVLIISNLIRYQCAYPIIPMYYTKLWGNNFITSTTINRVERFHTNCNYRRKQPTYTNIVKVKLNTLRFVMGYFFVIKAVFLSY